MTSKANGQFNNTGGRGLGDYQHAARTFVDSDFALAPRLKFQYHVLFSGRGLNSDLNLLVKSVDLPKFQIANETVNQYNRKRVIQTSMTYQPITIKFHDDNSNTVRQLWESYYKYYFSDSKAATNNLYQKSQWAPLSFYGLENQPVRAFLNYIKVHTFAKRSYAGYKLINPMIVGWSHDNMTYSSSDVAEHTMTIAYEAVVYDSGAVGADSPPGFGTAHYDRTPSPLTVGGSTSTTAVIGTPGVRTGAEQIFGNSTPIGTTDRRTIQAAQAATASTNLYNNSKTLTNAGAAPNSNPVILSTTPRAATGQGSLNNFSFPITEPASNRTVGVLKNITGT